MRYFPKDFRRSSIGASLSLAGHVIIAVLLMVEVSGQIELLPATEIPVEIVMEKPPEARPQKEVSNEQKRPPAFSPAVADTDKRAQAPPAAWNVNGIDQPKQTGQDGSDPSSDVIGLPVPSTDSGLAAGGVPAPSRAVISRPIGPALPQIAAREPGKDEWTAIAEQKIQCGVMAKLPALAVAMRKQARVRGIATEAQALAILRKTQAAADRRMNPNYINERRVFVENLDSGTKSVVLLPSGLTVNVGDVIEYDRGYVDPSNSCQYIPNHAVRKL